MARVTLPLSITETVMLVRRRELTAVELVELSLRAIDEREQELNAFLEVTRERALEAGRAIDAALAAGDEPGPLVGVPFAVKDAFVTVDAPTTAGSSYYTAPPASHDATLVARLRAAGAILVGKTNMNEFGWGLDPSVGPVANPTLAGRSAGGSSGGSAAAVAARSVVFSLGTDGGGSIRMPAAFCGVVGLKPTHGAVPHDGAISGGSSSLTDAGPITHSVADARAVLEILTGTPLTSEVEAGHDMIGVVAGSIATYAPVVAEPLADAVAALSATTDVDLDLCGAPDAWYAIFSAEAAAELPLTLGRLLPHMSSDLRRLVAEGEQVRAVDYLAARVTANELAEQVDLALKHCAALLAPTVPSPPPAEEPAWDDDDFFGDMRWTVLANLTGHPAVSIPVPGAAEPVGLQLIGRRGCDGVLLALAQRVEQELRDCHGDGRRNPTLG